MQVIKNPVNGKCSYYYLTFFFYYYLTLLYRSQEMWYHNGKRECRAINKN